MPGVGVGGGVDPGSDTDAILYPASISETQLGVHLVTNTGLMVTGISQTRLGVHFVEIPPYDTLVVLGMNSTMLGQGALVEENNNDSLQVSGVEPTSLGVATVTDLLTKILSPSSLVETAYGRHHVLQDVEECQCFPVVDGWGYNDIPGCIGITRMSDET